MKLHSNYGIVAARETVGRAPPSSFGLRALAFDANFGALGGRDGREIASYEDEFWPFVGARRRVSVSACETPQQQNALFGGALGAGTGALIGSAVSGGSAGGALAGAAIGAGSGALIGSAATPSGLLRRAAGGTMAGRRRADAPNGPTTTTAIGSAPLSIESIGET